MTSHFLGCSYLPAIISSFGIFDSNPMQMMLSSRSTLILALLIANAWKLVLACPYLAKQTQNEPNNPHIERKLRKEMAMKTQDPQEHRKLHLNIFDSMFVMIRSMIFMNREEGGEGDDVGVALAAVDGEDGENGDNNNRGGGGGGRGGGRGRGGNNDNGRGGNNDNAGNGVVIDATAVVGLDVDTALTDARADIDAIMTNNLAAKFVRLAFHDCVGGCDGCVNLSSPDNFGLDEPITALSNIVSKYSQTDLTRADVWVLAALTAAEHAQIAGGGGRGGGGGGGGNGGGNDGNVVTLPFDMQYVGRAVCGVDATRGPARELPSAHLTTQGVLDYFDVNFAFDTQDTVAIMGAHTLGRAVQENSGFNGNNGWVPNRNRLSNQFYRVLLDGDGEVDADFEPELQNNDNNDNFPNQFLWRRNNNLFMLNADMALAVDFEGHIDEETGEVTCSLNGGDTVCPVATDTLSIANNYAASNTEWLNDFHTAFIKMTGKGCETGGCTAL